MRRCAADSECGSNAFCDDFVCVRRATNDDGKAGGTGTGGGEGAGGGGTAGGSGGGAPKHYPAPGNLVVTSGNDALVLAWVAAASTELIGYAILREGFELAVVGPTVVEYRDTTAEPAVLASPTNVKASDDSTETVELSWGEPPAATAKRYDYAVVALYPTGQSERTPLVFGQRTAEPSGYEVSVNGAAPQAVTGQTRFAYAQAPKAIFAAGTAVATTDYSRGLIRLEIAQWPTVTTPAAPVDFRVRAVAGTQLGPWASATGRRKVEDARWAKVQWERASGSTWVPLTGVTGSRWFDASPPAGSSSYRAVLTVPGAETTLATGATASDPQVSQLALGAHATCALRASDQTRVCWGDNSAGQAPPGPSTDSFVTIALGGRHGYGLRGSGQLPVFWGDNSAGQDIAPAADYEQLSVKDDTTCFYGAPSTRPHCSGSLSTTLGRPITGLTVGRAHACGMDGAQLVCWGNSSAIPSQIPFGGPYQAVSAGVDHTCAIKTDGYPECWGANGFGQATPPSVRLGEISSGRAHTCGVDPGTRQPVCWGAPYLAHGAFAGPVKSLVAGGAHTCVIRASDDGVSCWGSNDFGESPPTPPQEKMTSVSVGRMHSCALTTSGHLRCAGYAMNGLPQPASTDTFKQVVSGFGFVCALRTADSTAKCWGIAAPPSDAFSTLAAGPEHACGIRVADQKAVCWGKNDFGQAPSSPSSSTYVALAAGRAYTCGLRQTDGKLECWGNPHPNQLPVLPPSASHKSLAISELALCALRLDGTIDCAGVTPPSGTGFKALQGGLAGFCAVASSGLPVCWGSPAPSPIPAPPPEPMLDVAVGLDHGCGVRATDGKLICWGINELGKAPRP